MPTLDSIVSYLDRELRLDAFHDVSNNGLQVANKGKVVKICGGVDGSVEFFEKARDCGADFLVCHHGISWRDSLKRITELNYKAVSFLIENNMALYAAHLPLDAHPRVGHNAQLCKALGLTSLVRFGEYAGTEIGFQGKLPKPMPYQAFLELVRRKISSDIRTMDFGPKVVRSVAIVSGGAADEIKEAGEKGIDVYLTGEPKLEAYSLAQGYKIHGVFAGHYATETFGVKALCKMLGRRFAVPTEFVDLGIKF